MVIPSRIWEYSIAALLIIVAPGPSVLFTIARAIAWGRAIAIYTVIGNILGMYTMAVIVSFGLSPILAKSHLAFTGVQWLGGLYLIYLGYSAIKESPRDAEDMLKVVESRPSPAKTIRQGYPRRWSLPCRKIASGSLCIAVSAARESRQFAHYRSMGRQSCRPAT